jgi:hypothetical protein
MSDTKNPYEELNRLKKVNAIMALLDKTCGYVKGDKADKVIAVLVATPKSEMDKFCSMAGTTPASNETIKAVLMELRRRAEM